MKKVPVDQYHIKQVIDAINDLCAPTEKILHEELSQIQYEELAMAVTNLNRWMYLHRPGGAK